MEEQIYETDYWKVILMEDQAYLGRSAIVLKRTCGELSKLTSEEYSDFHTNIVTTLENTFKKTFNATMFNWTCLMNAAFKSDKPQPQIHWHFRPRYRNKVIFTGEEFQDKEFGHHYSRERKKTVSKEVLQEIAKEIRESV